jgi:hypothetical protein
MTYWRTPDTLLISRKPKPELGQLAIEILGKHHHGLARTPWRQRPVLAAIGLRRLANRSIDITDLCQAMSEKPEDALIALNLSPVNVLWKFIELLDAKNLYWGDISRIDTLISGSALPPWARGLHQLDAPIAKLIYDDADKTAAWSRLFKDGLNVDDTAMLYAWRKLEITSHGILRGPKPLAPLWSQPTSARDVLDFLDDFNQALSAGQIALDDAPTIRSDVPHKALQSPDELDEYRQWHPKPPQNLENGLMLGTIGIAIVGRHPWRSWYRFEQPAHQYCTDVKLVDVIWENAGFSEDSPDQPEERPFTPELALRQVIKTVSADSISEYGAELQDICEGQFCDRRVGRCYWLEFVGETLRTTQ